MQSEPTNTPPAERAANGLVNCPCCDGAADLNSYKPNYLWSLGCNACGIRLQFIGPTELDAAKAKWNKRPTSALQKRVEELDQTAIDLATTVDDQRQTIAALTEEKAKLQSQVENRREKDSAKFNPVAKTPQEHASNCEFQLLNVKGWLIAMADGHDAKVAARVKAECLLESAKKLVEALQ